MPAANHIDPDTTAALVVSGVVTLVRNPPCNVQVMYGVNPPG